MGARGFLELGVEDHAVTRIALVDEHGGRDVEMHAVLVVHSDAARVALDLVVVSGPWPSIDGGKEKIKNRGGCRPERED
jgi:hypothetical protein